MDKQHFTFPVVATLLRFSVFCFDSVASFSDLLLWGEDSDIPSESPPPALLLLLTERGR